jgi:thioesterase domain-containing protein
MGGLIAFEMARQLKVQGEEVALLAMVDSLPPGAAQETVISELDLMFNFAQELGLPAERIVLPWEQIRELAGEELLAFMLEQAKESGAVPADITPDRAQRLWDVYRNNVTALNKYKGGAYEGRVVLFHKTDGESDTTNLDTTVGGWRRLLGAHLLTEEVSGSHYTMIQEPHVGVLAELLGAYLAEEGANEEGAQGQIFIS